MKNNLFLKKKYLYIVLVFILVILDQISKQAMLIISKGEIGYSIMPFNSDFLLLTYVENHGGIFGIFQGHIRIFTILSFFLIFFVVYSEFKNIKTYNTLTQIGICFITAGALGNMIDRVLRLYVIDMINFHYVWKFIFNIADVYIHIGIYLILINYVYTNLKKGV